jgi:hypothetical protein
VFAACDPHCADACDKRGSATCDSTCETGWVWQDDYTCARELQCLVSVTCIAQQGGGVSKITITIFFFIFFPKMSRVRWAHVLFTFPKYDLWNEWMIFHGPCWMRCPTAQMPNTDNREVNSFKSYSLSKMVTGGHLTFRSTFGARACHIWSRWVNLFAGHHCG